MAKKETVFDTRYLSSDYERHDFGSQPKPLALDMKSGDQVLANTHDPFGIPLTPPARLTQKYLDSYILSFHEKLKATF